MSLIFCACGCGGQREEFDKWGRKHKYINGHQRKNKPSPMKGIPRSEKTKLKISESHIGIPRSEKTKLKISNTRIQNETARGNKHPNWKGGITPLYQIIRYLSIYSEWRDRVFWRDNYQCRQCGDKIGGNLHSHHIKRFADIIKESKILSQEEALLCNALWNIDNGITYCKSCHELLGNKGGLL